MGNQIFLINFTFFNFHVCEMYKGLKKKMRTPVSQSLCTSMSQSYSTALARSLQGGEDISSDTRVSLSDPMHLTRDTYPSPSLPVRFAQLQPLGRDFRRGPQPTARWENPTAGIRSSAAAAGAAAGARRLWFAERAASPPAPLFVNTPSAVRNDTYGREESASECSGTGPARAGQGGNGFQNITMQKYKVKNHQLETSN